MSMRRDEIIEGLDRKIERLKYEYDQYFAGNRRREPTWEMRDIERQLLEATRSANTSTQFQFQLRGLAQRFRSVQAQVRNISRTRQRRFTEKHHPKTPSVIIDSVALKNPELIANKVKEMCRKAGGEEKIQGLNEAALQQMLVQKAGTMVGKDNVAAIRFSFDTSTGGPKLKGEKITSRPKG